jgi:hypothetical protein
VSLHLSLFCCTSNRGDVDGLGLNGNCKVHGMPPPPPPPSHITPSRASQHPLLRSTELQDPELDETDGETADGVGEVRRRACWSNCPEVTKAVEGVRFIAEHTRREEESIRVSIIISSYIEETYTLFFTSGERRLEVRGYGVGSSFPLDLHSGRACGDGRHHSPSTNSLR